MKKTFSLFSAVLSLFCNAAFSAPTVEKEEEHPVVILGGGVAALTSATYLARGGIPPLVLTGPIVGGAITQSHCVQNWPGELEISGFDLADKLRDQAEVNGAVLRSEVVVAVDFSKRPFTLSTQELFQADGHVKKIKAQSCIIALGSTPNLLGVSGETGESGYWSRGVYSCAVCDGSFYKDKVVAVAGGGDGALIEAYYLSNIAEKVYIIVRGEQFRTVEKERAKRIIEKSNIEVIYRTEIQSIQGDDEKVTHLVLKNNQNKNTQELPIDALFLAIGAKPNTEMFQNQLQLDDNGYIVLKKHQETSVSGIYAVGDVCDPYFKQAVAAAGDAAKAALQAQNDLASFQQNAPVMTVSHSSKLPPVIELFSKEQLVKELDNWDGAAFIDFYSTRCAPCRAFAPMYEKWAKDFRGRIKFFKANSDYAPSLFSKYQIRGVPTLLILDGDGKVVCRSVGGGEIGVINRRLEKARNESKIDPQIFQ